MEKASVVKSSQKGKPVTDQDTYWFLDDAGVGFCLGCGNKVEGLVADAYRKECPKCSAKKVYSIFELVQMGSIAVLPRRMEN